MTGFRSYFSGRQAMEHVNKAACHTSESLAELVTKGISASEIIPLIYPSRWPPPEPPPIPAHSIYRIPLIGRVFALFTFVRIWNKHQREILDPLADDIVQQLERRPIEGDWPTSPEHKLMTRIISEAVCLEKGLNHPPALHPQDPMPLLFWGSSDDLTPLIVHIEFGKRFQCELPLSLIERAWQEQWTIETFVSHCDRMRLEYIARQFLRTSQSKTKPKRESGLRQEFSR